MPATFTCEFCERFTTPDRKALRLHQTKAASCQKKRDAHLRLLRSQFSSQNISYDTSNNETPTFIPSPPPMAPEVDEMITNVVDELPTLPPIQSAAVSIDVGPDEAISADADARQPRIEDVVDEDDPSYYLDEFPLEQEAGAAFGEGRTSFHKIRDDQVLNGAEILGPFRDNDEWELAKWLIKNVGHNQADAFLKLPIVSC